MSSDYTRTAIAPGLLNGAFGDSTTARYNFLVLLAFFLFTLVDMVAAAVIWKATAFDTLALAITGITIAGGVAGGTIVSTTTRNVKAEAPMRDAAAAVYTAAQTSRGRTGATPAPTPAIRN